MRRRTRTIFTALLLAAAAAGGHASGAAAQPVTGVGAGGVVGVTVSSGPRFLVEAETFRADDETGIDIFGDDEVVFVLSTRNHKLISLEYAGDSDEGEQAFFSDHALFIAPARDSSGYNNLWNRDPAGVAGPLYIGIAAYEQDTDWWGFCAKNLKPDSDLRPLSSEACEIDEWGTLIGGREFEVPLATLLDRLRETGAAYTETIDLQGGCIVLPTRPCSSGDSPHYVVTYKATRLPDAAGPGVIAQP